MITQSLVFSLIINPTSIITVKQIKWVFSNNLKDNFYQFSIKTCVVGTQ